LTPMGKATTGSPESEAQWRREVDRCRAEIAAAKSLLLAGHPDVEGLCMALADWSAELRILRAEAPPGRGIRQWEASTGGQARREGVSPQCEGIRRYRFSAQTTPPLRRRLLVRVEYINGPKRVYRS
jgi:hypothetical protein